MMTETDYLKCTYISSKYQNLFHNNRGQAFCIGPDGNHEEIKFDEKSKNTILVETPSKDDGTMAVITLASEDY